TLVIPESGNAVRVRVAVIDDLETESTEGVKLTATTTDNNVADQEASDTVYIFDDLVEREDGSKVDADAPDLVVTGAANVTESDDAYLEYDVSLSGPAAGAVNVSLSLSGDATSGEDYNPQIQYFDGQDWVNYTGTLVIPESGNAVRVRVAVIDDLETESTEGVKLTATTTDNNVADQEASDTV
ncbi:Calx-beta domain-containing protein, partial [Vibrio sp. M260112]